jgi:hypothetical protein
MPQPLQHRRGATLPASLAEGEFFFKTDTEIWYSGPTGGGTPVIVNAMPPIFTTLGVLTVEFSDEANEIYFFPISGDPVVSLLTEVTTGVYSVPVAFHGLPACGGILAGNSGTPVLLVSINTDRNDLVYVYDTSGIATDPTGAEGMVSFLIRR